LGTKIDYAKIFLAVIVAFPIAILMCFIIALISDTQINAIAYLKVIGAVYFTIPMASLFTPLKYHFVYYVFPNYWVFNVFKSIFVPAYENDFFISFLVSIFFAIILFLISIYLSKKMFKQGKLSLKF